MAIAAHPARPSHATFHPLSPASLTDPFAVLASLPPETPVFYSSSIDYYVVTKYADIEAVFLDPEAYSAAPAQLPLAEIVPEAAKLLLDVGLMPHPAMVSLD